MYVWKGRLFSCVIHMTSLHSMVRSQPTHTQTRTAHAWPNRGSNTNTPQTLRFVHHASSSLSPLPSHSRSTNLKGAGLKQSHSSTPVTAYISTMGVEGPWLWSIACVFETLPKSVQLVGPTLELSRCSCSPDAFTFWAVMFPRLYNFASARKQIRIAHEIAVLLPWM